MSPLHGLKTYPMTSFFCHTSHIKTGREITREIRAVREMMDLRPGRGADSILPPTLTGFCARRKGLAQLGLEEYFWLI